MKRLGHNQRIRTGMDKGYSEVRVGTVAGYAVENSDDPVTAVAREIAKMARHPHADHCLAWTVQAAVVVCADYPGKDAERKANEQEYAESVLIEDGEIVTIEDEEYKVRYTGMGYSDPIKFIARPINLERLPDPIKPAE